MQPGDVLRDKYEIVSSIGKGGMGEVFHAIDLASDTDVAVKVVSRKYAGDVLMARLEREAAAATRIESEFIPRVLDLDRNDDGELFLVMELLRGESLSEHLKRNGGILPWEEVSQIGENVLRGLMDAHAAGVVHRDLKPGNIFIEFLDDGLARARILDFGVCKLDGNDDVGEKLTVTGESVGTIAYMAPEQIRGASGVDERADLYSFAMVIFEAVSGRLAYDASGQMALLASKLERSARPLKGSAQVPIPLLLDGLVDRCLSREPQHRPASARDLLKLWRALGGATQVPSSLPIVTSDGLLNAPTQTVLTAGTINAAMRARAPRWPMMLAGSVVLLGVLVALNALRPAHAPAKAIETSASPVAPPVAAATATDTTVTTTAAEEPIEFGATDAGASGRHVVSVSSPRPRSPKPIVKKSAVAPAPTIVEKPRY
jgi:serine/threonine protein kinase